MGDLSITYSLPLPYVFLDWFLKGSYGWLAVKWIKNIDGVLFYDWFFMVVL